MRKLILSNLILLLTCGCQSDNKSKSPESEAARRAVTQKIIASKVAGESVLLVCGEVVTGKEVIELPVRLNGKLVSPIEYFKPIAQASTLEDFKNKARSQLEEVVMDKVSEILLYQEAKRQAGNNISEEALEKAAEKEVRKFIMYFGGDEAKALENLKQIGLDRSSFKEKQKRFILTQWYISSKFLDDRPVSYAELVKRYMQIREKSFATPASTQFRLIDIQPAKLEVVDPNQNRLEQARKLAGKLVERIKAGEDFGELARQYSHDYRREFGGLWNPVQPDSLAKPYDVLAAEAEKIQPGQIAGPIEAEGHVFIMKLEEKRAKSYALLEQVQRELERSIISERRKIASEKLNAELMQSAPDGIGEKDAFLDFCLEKIYQMNKQ
jgi:peptidyl-prolyl cis-trans isomerase SurA